MEIGEMAQFRATIQGQRGEASRLGSKNSGMEASVNGWDKGIKVYANHANEQDEFEVYVSGGSNSRGHSRRMMRIVDLGNGKFGVKLYSVDGVCVYAREI